MKTLYKSISLVSLSILVITVQSCNTECIQGSGKNATDKRQVAEFTKLDIAGSFNVTLVQDSSNSVTINADDNIISVVKTDMSGDKLKISTDNKNICSSKEIAITIGVRNLKSIAASGAVEVTSNGRLNLGDLDLNLSGATKINLNIAASNVETKGSGVNDISLKGQASSHAIELSGSGNVHGFDFVVGNYSIETSGQSDCEINVLNELNIHSTGASDIKYKGNPTKINKSKTGALSLAKVE
nr:head GIN domain-containing protein [uncultured Mucilaginibacter sp.]